MVRLLELAAWPEVVNGVTGEDDMISCFIFNGILIDLSSAGATRALVSASERLRFLSKLACNAESAETFN